MTRWGIRGGKLGEIRDSHLFLSDVKARRDKIVETRRMTADGLRLTAYDPGDDEIRIVEDPPKAKSPRVRADRLRPTANGGRQRMEGDLTDQRHSEELFSAKVAAVLTD